jgi:hypothetical protein
MAYLVDNIYLFTGDIAKVNGKNFEVHPFSEDKDVEDTILKSLKNMLYANSVVLTSHYGYHENMAVEGAPLHPATVPEESLPVADDIQLSPPPNQDFPEEFASVYSMFEGIVERRDYAAIEDFLFEDVVSSNYGQPGKEEFMDYWSLENTRDDSALWPVLDEILTLGGRYDPANKVFQAPYVYIDVPAEYRSDYGFVVMGEDVNLYEEKDLHSNVKAALSYNIIYISRDERNFYLKEDEDLIGIVTLSGNGGFIQKKYMKSHIDYRMEIRNIDGEWKLTVLLMGV